MTKNEIAAVAVGFFAMTGTGFGACAGMTRNSVKGLKSLKGRGGIADLKFQISEKKERCEGGGV